MAAAKRSKKTASRKKSTSAKRKTQASKTQSRLARVCLLFCGIALGIIGAFHLGIIGSLLHQFVSLWTGSLTFIVFMLMILVCVMILFKFDFKKIPVRYFIGCLVLMVSWLMVEGLRSIQNQEAWSALMHIFKNFLPILSGSQNTTCGLFGAILTGLFYMLFDRTGCIVLIVLTFVMGLGLLFYDLVLSFYKERQSMPKERKPKTQKKNVYSDEKPLKTKQSMFIDADDSQTFIEEPSAPVVAEPIEPKTREKEMEMVEEPWEPAEYIANEEEAYANYKLPRMTILNEIPKRSRNNPNAQYARQQGDKLIEILQEFGVNATLVQIHIGPSVTKFEIRPELGVRVNRISNLQYDIKMALAAKDIRIEAPIPGKSAVGIEIPNAEKTQVQMKELMANVPKNLSDKTLLFCLGKDLMGNCVYGQLDKMPHLLIAGATGSGKSVCVNSIISSFLLRTRPDEIKLVLIDPKKVEFTPYNDVPHLLAPVITDGDLANKALKVIVQIMEHRYDLFGHLGVRNIQSYNDYVLDHPDESLKPLARIVVIIDELADLMLVAAKEVESSIQRITQLARAAGIHLIVATQRPSVDVITGVIKANIPSRIAFAVSSSTDSRTILDQAGAERLLGYGDMLYLPNGETTPKRIQGVFIRDDEVSRIARYVKSQASPHYDDAFIQLKDLQNQGEDVISECSDPLYEQVKNFVIQSRRASTSLIQRKFSVGYSRAARLIDALEEQGVIGPANGSKPRQILVQNTLEDPLEE